MVGFEKKVPQREVEKKMAANINKLIGDVNSFTMDRFKCWNNLLRKVGSLQNKYYDSI